MSTRTAACLDAIEHLPDGATLVLHNFSWDDYERLLHELEERPHRRVSYDRGRLEVMSPLNEHEEDGRFIDLMVYFIAESLHLNVQNCGCTTWKRQHLARGAEPDGCYYVANAERVIGKRRINLEKDPAPDIVLEIDITNESLSKFSIYAALGVPEIWRYDGSKMQFYKLSGTTYRKIAQSQFFPGLVPALLAGTLEQSKTIGQTAALAEFRRQIAIPKRG